MTTNNVIYSIPVEDQSSTIPNYCNIYADAEQISVEEVAATVPNKDNPEIPCCTVRAVIFGIIVVLITSCVHQWTVFTPADLYIDPVLVIVIVYLFSRFLLPICVTSLNIKEHTLILIMFNVAWSFNTQYRYATLHTISQLEANNVKFVYIFLLFFALQFLGFGLAGIVRRFLVWPPGQVWPANLPDIAILRTLHEDQTKVEEKIYSNKKRSFLHKIISNRRTFFFIVASCQFVYCCAPRYIMPVLGAFSWICMIKPDNRLLSQFTSSTGLGMGGLSFDWLRLYSHIGSPLVVPRWALLNIAAGFVVVAWILTPSVYFTNTWQSNSVAIAGLGSNSVWSAITIVTTAITFASLSAVLVHMLLYDRKELWTQITHKSLAYKGNDLHCRLISAYADTPDWWFVLVTLMAFIMITILCEVMHLLRWYYIPLTLLIPFVFVVPFGRVNSITGQIVQNQGIYYFCVIISIYLFQDVNQHISRLTFVTLSYTTFCQTLYLVSDMKLSHYMKVSPRALFFVQLLSCLICVPFNMGIYVAFRQRRKARDVQDLFQWSSIGRFVSRPSTFFEHIILYKVFFWMFLVGAVLPIAFWLASRRWSILRHVHIPLLLSTVSWMPLMIPGVLFTWLIIGLLSHAIFSTMIWKRHIYLFSAASELGFNAMTLILDAALVNQNITFPAWWGTGGRSSDGCPLSCQDVSGNYSCATNFDIYNN